MTKPKKIVFCADGTWNGPDADEDKDGLPDITNVLKLFLMLKGDNTWSTIRLKDEQEKTLTDSTGDLSLVAKYLHGVGDSDNPIKKLLGGALGAGIIARIVRGYTFISRHYCPGDEIYIVGFSRGAYTARALAGLITAQGLLNPSKSNLADKDLAYSLGTSAWRSYREHIGNGAAAEVKQRFLNIINQLPGFARISMQDYAYVPASIKCVAVWDTVGALGVPLFKVDGDPMDIFRFADLDLSEKVALGFHILSYDEQRKNFLPTLWNRRDNVTQILFHGAHADVGGGYPMTGESGLSDLALQWMLGKLQATGLPFNTPPKEFQPNAQGAMHTPWKDLPFSKFPFGPRVWNIQEQGLQVESSLAARIAA